MLTKILQENGESTVKAETFRLAKFNDKDAVSSTDLVFRVLETDRLD